MTADEAKEQFRCQLKDLIWSFRRQYAKSPFVNAVDRFFPYIALINQDWTLDQLKAKLVAFGKTLPNQIEAVLLNYIQNTVLMYWSFCNNPNERTANTLERRFKFMWSVLQADRDGCKLEEDQVRGWRLVVKK